MTSTQSKYGGARVPFPPPPVFLTLAGVGATIQRWLWPISSAVAYWPRTIGGSAAAILGLSLLIAATIWLTRTGQDPAPWKPTPTLVVYGIYRRTRNPMYVGMTFAQLGLGLVFDNLWIAAVAPLALAVVHFLAVLPEERYLEEKFGESYRRYKADVRRYL
jgi:protein-S-isoprenylcysteine O-methyltransferase Ste14